MSFVLLNWKIISLHFLTFKLNLFPFDQAWTLDAADYISVVNVDPIVELRD